MVQIALLLGFFTDTGQGIGLLDFAGIFPDVLFQSAAMPVVIDQMKLRPILSDTDFIMGAGNFYRMGTFAQVFNLDSLG
jgi:hypothetical protein